MKFIGRTYELAQLDEQYQRAEATFLIVYGRRRIGKTRLLTHWLNTRAVPGFYWVATQTSPDRLLASFSEAVYRHITGQDAARGFTYSSWEDAFVQLAQVIEQRQEKTAIILDEFTYAMESDSALASILQKLWDHQLKTLPLFLVLSGSQVGMMERDVMAYRAPLYGRATGRLQLRALPFKDLRAFFPAYDMPARVAVYAILGGIPFYLEQFNPDWSVSDNIKRRIIESTSLLQEEPRLLLHEQVQEPRLYIAVLGAIAHGNTRLSEIALDTGLAPNTAAKYLTTMTNLGLLQREVPATVRHPEKSGKGRYVITDAYLRFYFRFIHPRISDIAAGLTADVIANISEHLLSFIGTYAFEDLCRQWVQLAGAAQQLPFLPERVGAHWSKNVQLDVVAINWRSHHLLVGECKWGAAGPLGVAVVDKLYTQAQQIIPQDAQKRPFTVHYACFARSGFTTAALARLDELNGLAVDLPRLEAGLAQAVR